MFRKQPHAFGFQRVNAKVTLKRLGRQGFSSLLPPSEQNFSAVGCTHSFAKAMFLRALPLLRLECHLHAKHLLATSITRNRLRAVL